MEQRFVCVYIYMTQSKLYIALPHLGLRNPYKKITTLSEVSLEKIDKCWQDPKMSLYYTTYWIG